MRFKNRHIKAFQIFTNNVNFFNNNGINTLFTITGGFAMHLNDSFGKNDQYNTDGFDGNVIEEGKKRVDQKRIDGVCAHRADLNSSIFK